MFPQAGPLGEEEVLLKITTALKDQTAQVGDAEAVFNVCVNQSSPDGLEITWYKNGQQIDSSSRKYEINFVNGIVSLRILRIEESDEGEYLCRIVKANHKLETAAKLHVKAAEKKIKKKVKKSPSPTEAFEEPPSFHLTLKDESVKVGDRLVLAVTNTTMPEPEVEWSRNGQKIVESDQKYRLRKDKGRYELEIIACELIDSAEWKAVGKNAFGTCESSCQITVVSPDGKQRPEFKRKLESLTVYKTEMVKLEVTVVGEPAPTVSWKRNGTMLKQTEKYRIQSDETSKKYTLTIMDSVVEDSGTYEVVAKNSLGESSCSCVVTVRDGSPRTDEGEESHAPVFRMPLPAARELPENLEVTLVCAVTGTPTPKIEWNKDGKPCANASATFENGVCTLLIKGAKRTHSGLYTCTASNTHGEVKSTCVLTIQPSEEAITMKPKFKDPLSNVSAIENTEVVFECCVVGKPIPQITWYKDGLKMLMNSRMLQYVDRKGVVRLNIMNVTPDDAGEYTCEAENSEGKDFTHAELKVVDMGITKPTKREPSPAREPTRPIITRGLNDSKVHEGNRELLEVEVEAFPEATAEWYFNGEKITESKLLRTYFDGRIAFLKIYEAKKEHEGEYMCRISNNLGSVTTRCKVTVEAATGTEDYLLNMPRFSQKLENISVRVESETIVLRCEAEGTPQPEVRWLFNGKAIHAGPEIETKKEDNVYSLEIKEFSNKWCGTYTAIASNIYGDAHCSADVSFVDKESLKIEETVPAREDQSPVFTKALKDKTAMAGETVNLKCVITGVPDPDITWLKDDEVINTTRKRQLKFDENGACTLTISNVSAEDTGIYMCTARNRAGVQSTECMLTIASTVGPDAHLVTADTTKGKKSKPQFTRIPASTINIGEGSPLELVARAIGEPAPRITWQKDGKEITRTNKLYSIRVTGTGESILCLECAVLKSSGQFTCIAENSEGSEQVDIQLIVTRAGYDTTKKLAPNFTKELEDMGVVTGHPVTLKCTVEGRPDPHLSWFYVNDNRKTVPLSDLKGVWTEYRVGNEIEIRANTVVKTQQGTYQCVARNEHGESITQCYLLVGETSDKPAGPPRFLKCLRDIWSPIGADVEFEVEIGGFPLPDLTWFHNGEKIIEKRQYQITYPTPTKCLLKISGIHVSDIGSYSVEASNVHGTVQTNGSLNVGEPRNLKPPVFTGIETEEIVIQTFESYKTGDKKDVRRVHLHSKRKGAAPNFVVGLEDLELKAGDAAAVAGKLAKKRRKGPSRTDAKGLAESVLAGTSLEEPGPVSMQDSKEEPSTTLEDIRFAVQERNKKPCRPKFLVKPKPKKSLEEYKSLRLKTAVSANPQAEVTWDKNGMILETGNKYSIYHDGDFYYLEVHHVSVYDKGFYNCTASNAEGIATCSSEVEVIAADAEKIELMRRRSRKEPKAPTFVEVLPGKFKAQQGETTSVECSVYGYPAPAISWHRNGTALIPQPDRYQMFYDGECATLKFINLSSAEAGTYTCKAENALGSASSQMNLEVEGKKKTAADGTPPKFSFEKKVLDPVTDGSKAVLEAELVEGSKPVNVRWMHNRMEVTDSSGFTHGRIGDKMTLTIQDAFPEDAGEYYCVAENAVGTAKCCMTVQIKEQTEKSLAEEMPIVKALNKTIDAEFGSTTIVSVSAKGHPDPVITWFKGGKQLAPGSKYQTSNVENVFHLRICELTAEDSGSYKLQAVNTSGSASAFVQVNVIEPPLGSTSVLPRFTRPPISLQLAVGQKAELSCEFEGQPRPVVSWFQGDRRLHDGDADIEIESTATASRLSILKVTEKHLGEYLCTIRNTFGEDLATAMILLEGSSAALPPRRTGKTSPK
ncbi:hypothetical protein QR680_003864 [Steinernema hermaphroditum]|uniref:Ig-like domain-containing protein n=1 Tax=Steinernema hermaphroditum TaxID=289476 RepID=A0AA39HMW6_9BILA|nr:hypothetical protein QR680_003864 [Steinernema hermaphroditum]